MTQRYIAVHLKALTRFLSQNHSPAIDVEKYFVSSDVQNILKKITGFDINKIYRERKISDVEPPSYRLLTAKQLQEYERLAEQRGHQLLQMPPVKNAWQTTSKTLSVDDIAQFERSTDCRYVFTDITYGLPHTQRYIVVREADGTLRLASRQEHDRIRHVYYPRQGKMYAVPKIFEEDNLEKVLSQHRYEYILDRACIQFEPDDPAYIQVSQRTYEHVANEGRFNDLRSTRHFGPMAFYLCLQNNIDGLLVDMLQHGLLSDASDLIKLFHILHPDSKSAAEVRKQMFSDPHQIIQCYIELDAISAGPVELALHSLQEQSSR